MENIGFHTSPPHYCAANLTLTCTTSVDGTLVCHAVTAEALEEHFGVRSWRQRGLLRTMESYRGTAEDTAHSLFKLMNSYNIMLRSGHFQFNMQLSRKQHDRHLRLRWV